MMICATISLLRSPIEEQILGIEGLTPHYVCVLSRPHNLDELVVQVEHAPHPTQGAPDADALAAQLREQMWFGGSE